MNAVQETTSELVTSVPDIGLFFGEIQRKILLQQLNDRQKQPIPTAELYGIDNLWSNPVPLDYTK